MIQGKRKKKLFWSQRFPLCGYLLWFLHSPMMRVGAVVLPRQEWGAWVSLCTSLWSRLRARPATVGFQCWPQPLSHQAEKLVELSWMWNLSKSSQLCFFKEEKPLKHPVAHILSYFAQVLSECLWPNVRFSSTFTINHGVYCVKEWRK